MEVLSNQSKLVAVCGIDHKHPVAFYTACFVIARHAPVQDVADS